MKGSKVQSDEWRNRACQTNNRRLCVILLRDQVCRHACGDENCAWGWSLPGHQVLSARQTNVDTNDVFQKWFCQREGVGGRWGGGQGAHAICTDRGSCVTLWGLGGLLLFVSALLLPFGNVILGQLATLGIFPFGLGLPLLLPIGIFPFGPFLPLLLPIGMNSRLGA